MKNALNRDALLKKEELEVVKVDLSKDEFVYVRQMTGRERDIWERSLYRMEKRGKTMESVSTLEDFRAKLAVCTLCDEEGKLLLKPTDVSMLSQNMSAAKLELIINEAQKLNKISEEDKEELIKNSEDGQAVNSSSDSV